MRELRAGARTAQPCLPARQAVKMHRIHLLAAAEEDLGKVKRQFFLQLAKDRGVLAEYLRDVKVLPPARPACAWASCCKSKPVGKKRK